MEMIKQNSLNYLAVVFHKVRTTNHDLRERKLNLCLEKTMKTENMGEIELLEKVPSEKMGGKGNG